MAKVIGVPGIWRKDFPTGIYQVGCDYCDSLIRAGGVPLMLPMTENKAVIASYISLIDGLLLTGGGDVDPALYGEQNGGKSGFVSPERDAFELALLEGMLAAKKPVFGICRGFQVMNVFFGGSLYQDILQDVPGGKQHVGDMNNRPEEFHSVIVYPGSIMHKVFEKEQIRTNSFHHQALNKVAEGFTVTAVSQEDGVAEAFECMDKKMFGVEFHPENMTKPFPVFLGLFKALVDMCE